jgi:hypothetical protein
MSTQVDITVFKLNVRKYAVAAGKRVSDAIKEEAKLICQRVMQFTPPKTQAQGRKRVKSDLERVFLAPAWFETTFQFQTELLGDRVKKLVREKNETSIQAIFKNNPKLDRVKIEQFDVTKHKKFRRNGRVGKGVAPFSFPLQDQGKVKTYTTKKQSNVGIVKSGWAACLLQLGGSVAGWLSKRSSNGRAVVKEHEVILINQVGFAASVDGKGQFAKKAIAGRERDLLKKIDFAIKGVTWGK